MRGLPKEIQQMGTRKLRMIKNANDIPDLRIPPAKFWLVLQEDYDIEEELLALREQLNSIVSYDGKVA